MPEATEDQTTPEVEIVENDAEGDLSSDVRDIMSGVAIEPAETLDDTDDASDAIEDPEPVEAQDAPEPVSDDGDPLADLPPKWIRDAQADTGLGIDGLRNMAKSRPALFDKLMEKVSTRETTDETATPAESDDDNGLPTAGDFADVLRGLYDDDEIADEKLTEAGERLQKLLAPHLESASNAAKSSERQATAAQEARFEGIAEQVFASIEHGETLYGKGSTNAVKDPEMVQRRAGAYQLARAIQAGAKSHLKHDLDFSQAMQIAHQAIAFPQLKSLSTSEMTKSVAKQDARRTTRPGTSKKGGDGGKTPDQLLHDDVSRIFRGRG